jgi:hypothetical protein
MRDRDIRFRYISAIKNNAGHLAIKKSFLVIPDHLIETPFTMPVSTLNLGDKDELGKHGSFTNIFSCWNGMVGTGLVTIPWAYSKAGMLLGIILTVVAFAISFTTQYFIMKTAGADTDYTNTLRKTFGRKGYSMGMAAFIGILCVPLILFFQLLA